MHLYIPYASTHLIDDAVNHHSDQLTIRADFKYIDRPKIRKAAPRLKGIPHWDVSLRLFPETDHFRKFSIYGRRINGVCWHGHARFMARMFDEFPYMTLRSAILRDLGKGYYGVDDFLAKYQQTNDQMWNRNSTCRCE